jgi:integrase
MARRRSGQVFIDTRPASDTFSLRFRANGERHYLRLGTAAEGWTEAKAEIELANVLADVRRGIWRPAQREIVEVSEVIPQFADFATEWFQQHRQEGGQHGEGLAPTSVKSLEWVLCRHLLPAFGDYRLDEISVRHVDRYRQLKVADGGLSPASINKTLAVLCAIFEIAVEYDLIARNPARGRRRRLPASPPQRSWIDRAEHITALLEGAGRLDRQARVSPGQRRALIATLIFAGLRIGEALALRWRDVELARGTLTVRAAKTDAGVRSVNILPALHDELADFRARVDPRPEAMVFATSTGNALGPSNVRRRILSRAVALANERLEETESEPLQLRLTPHSLRRTFISLLFALGETPPYVMRQAGHTNPNFTLAVYAREMSRRDGEAERLKALVNGEPSESAANATEGDQLDGGNPAQQRRTA